ncbi:MAG: outer membrane lipoprotein carrier protein LolA [Puniceicoccales bacterium]|jgi:outer membrane lipoprotein-sorting protein|nr:outer membrane lipoprotein carrier protein LolA [Puniceicoccales bacterium]
MKSRRIIFSFLILLALAAGTPAHALVLEDLQKRFESIPVLRCEFQQEKQIHGIDKPLKSRGELLVAREAGLFWNQKKPFENTLLMNEGVLFQRIAGQPPQIITAEKQPQLFQLNRLLTGLFRADRAMLEKNFTTSFSEEGGRWKIVLSPREAPLDKIFRRITLSGEENFKTAIFEDAQGDLTTITFSNFKMSPPTLTAAEKEIFSQIPPLRE